MDNFKSVKNLELILNHLENFQIQNKLSKDECNKILNTFDFNEILELFNYFSNGKIKILIHYLDDKILSQILIKLSGKKLKDIVKLIPLKRFENIFHYNHSFNEMLTIFKNISKNFKKTYALKIKRNLDTNKLKIENDYPKDTVGILIKNDYMEVYDFEYVYEILMHFKMRQKFSELKNFEYFCILNDQNKFLGIIFFQDLFLASPKSKIKNIFQEKLITKIDPYTKTDQIIYEIQKSKHIIYPVVNDKNELLGILHTKDLLDHFYKETQNNFQKIAGIINVDNNRFDANFFKLVFSRLPSIMIGIFGGITTAMIITIFQTIFINNNFLYIFLPTIMSISGIIGVQTITIVIQGLTRYQFQNFHFKNFIHRELKIGFINSMFCGISLFAFCTIWHSFIHSFFIMIIVFIAGILSVLLSISIPLILNSVKIDPASNTGPFFTILNDLNTLMVYLFLGSIFISLSLF